MKKQAGKNKEQRKTVTEKEKFKGPYSPMDILLTLESYSSCSLKFMFILFNSLHLFGVS